MGGNSRGKFFLVFIVGLCFASTANAQALWPYSFEVAIGLGTGSTNGEYRDNSLGITAEAVLARRLRGEKGRFVVGASLAMQGQGPQTSDCILAADGGCVPWLPEFMTLSALGGYQLGTRATARIMAGPAYAAADESAIAWVARLDATLPIVWHISLAVSSRAALIPDYRGDAFRIHAFGIGLRVQ